MNQQLNLQNLLTQVTELTKEVGAYIRNETGNLQQADVESKGLHGFVTYVDKKAEDKLIAGLQEILPEAGFIAEESQPHKSESHLHWIIDPLDGTTNYIHGLPLFSVSIALQGKHETLLGVVYEINLDECFSAIKDHPATLNGKKISVSKQKKLHDSLLATGFPYYDYSRLDAYIEIFKYLLKNSHGIRRLGSAAADLVYVACGRFEGFYEYGLSPWDVAAGALIVKQAGGEINDFMGKDNFIHGGEIVATNGLIHDELMQVMQKYFVG
ncbi:MAG: inositol monophosphatase family protein [Bacteroidales bacterium]